MNIKREFAIIRQNIISNFFFETFILQLVKDGKVKRVKIWFLYGNNQVFKDGELLSRRQSVTRRPRIEFLR